MFNIEKSNKNIFLYDNKKDKYVVKKSISENKIKCGADNNDKKVVEIKSTKRNVKKSKTATNKNNKENSDPLLYYSSWEQNEEKDIDDSDILSAVKKNIYDHDNYKNNISKYNDKSINLNNSSPKNTRSKE